MQLHKLPSIFFQIIFILCFLTFFIHISKAEIVQLDSTFGGDGIITHNNAAGGNDDDVPWDMKVDANNKYIIVGSSRNSSGNWDMAIWRFNDDGTLDTSFNGQGYLAHHNAAGGNGHDIANAVIALRNGKYLVTGTSVRSGGNDSMTLWRINQNGTLDTSFNTTGYVTFANTAGGNGSDQGYDLKESSDGKYLVVGSSLNSSLNIDMVIWRINTDGTLDTSFNGTGYVVHHNAAGGNGHDGGQDIEVLSDGKYLIVGSSERSSNSYDMVIWRYNANGTLDTSFNSTGYVSHNNAGGGNDVHRGFDIKVQDDGKYVVVGTSENVSQNSDLALWRYNSNGTLDTSFNGSGYNTHDAAAGRSNTEMVYSFGIQNNGKILITGSSVAISWYYDMVIWRYNANGTLDTTFDNDGYITHNGLAETITNEGRSIMMLSNGKFIIAGKSWTMAAPGNDDLTLWRYESLYQVSNLDSGLTAKVNDTGIETGGSDGVTGIATVTVEDDSTYIVADLQVDMDQDRDWTDVSGDSDGNKVFFHNPGGFSAIPGAVGSGYDLYIPRAAGQNSVHICPGADSLADVYVGCSNGYTLLSTSPSVSQVTIDSKDYWKVSGMTGTGGLGTYTQGVGFSISPNESVASNTQEVTMSYTTVGGFISGDKIRVTWEAGSGLTLANTCTTPTQDADSDSTNDGSASIVGGNVYEYTFTGSTTQTDINLCVNVTGYDSMGSYSVSLNDDNGQYGAALYHIDDNNDVFVIAEISPTLSFNIRTLDDTGDLNICDLGTVDTGDSVPDGDTVVDGDGECGYGLAVGSNASGGVSIQVTGDGGMDNGSSEIADIVDNTSFAGGVEAYGYDYIEVATTGRDNSDGTYDEELTCGINFIGGGCNTGASDNTYTYDSGNTGRTPVPVGVTVIYDHDDGIFYSGSSDGYGGGNNAEDITKVMHGMVVGSGTPAGSYNQIITYTVTAAF